MYIWANGQLQKKKKTRSYILICLLLCIVFTYSLHRYHFHQVTGTSMEDTLVNGNIVIVDKFSSLTRYSIIAIQRSSTDEIVKRIIGIPGDSIEVVENELTLHLGNEPHSPTEIFRLSPEAVAQMNHLTYLPENTYFVLGDNPDISEDSRTFGLVSHSRILGKVIFK
ncbi:signal peptidase I [Enterococcus mundtii]|uniref:signal peptidase I n=1 Tax=Enterococcus mundtii TaxID=53346 RepID=UPI0015E7C5AA|nr:signal peptidase I [Enterococcus mundtii]